MRYEGNIFRPFSEANSYLLQCTIGCSYNRCTFCGMYKNKKYRIRNINEIKADIRMAKKYYRDVAEVFLCDGDAISMETDMLLEILAELYSTFPSLCHVGSYAGPVSTLAKDMSELKSLRDAGLTNAYLGVETGDDRLLKEIKKGVSAQEMLQAGKNLASAGITLSSMVLLGLAGKGHRSVAHAIATAEITNEMKPQYLAALTVTPVPNTVLYNQIRRGQFDLMNAFETLEEMRLLLENITVDNLKFVGDHASNYLSVNGTLQKDKERIIESINAVLNRRDRGMPRVERMQGL